MGVGRWAKGGVSRGDSDKAEEDEEEGGGEARWEGRERMCGGTLWVAMCVRRAERKRVLRCRRWNASCGEAC